MANVGDALGYAFATICRDMDCFTRIDVPRRIPIFLAEGDSFPTAWPRRPVPSPWLPRGRSFPLEDRPPPSGPIGTAPDRMGTAALWIGKSPSLSANWTEILLYSL
jgi:hypothetical protein